MLFIVYEYAAYLLAALTVGGMAFTMGAMCLVLWKAGGMALRR